MSSRTWTRTRNLPGSCRPSAPGHHRPRTRTIAQVSGRLSSSAVHECSPLGGSVWQPGCYTRCYTTMLPTASVILSGSPARRQATEILQLVLIFHRCLCQRSTGRTACGWDAGQTAVRVGGTPAAVWATATLAARQSTSTSDYPTRSSRRIGPRIVCPTLSSRDMSQPPLWPRRIDPVVRSNPARLTLVG